MLLPRPGCPQEAAPTLWGWDPLSSLYSPTEGWLSLGGKEVPSRGKAEDKDKASLLSSLRLPPKLPCPQTGWVQSPGQALPASPPANPPPCPDTSSPAAGAGTAHVNAQQPRVCARHTYPWVQGKPHVDSHLRVVRSPPRVHAHTGSSAYAARVCLRSERRPQRSHPTCSMYTYAAPRCLHDSEPAALGLRQGCAAPGTEEPVRAGPRGTGCGVGHKLGFPCRFAAVRCSRDAGMGSASWPPSQPRSCGRSCRGPGSSAGHGAGQQPAPAPAPAPGRAEAAAQGPGGVSGTAAAGSSA